MTALVKMLFFRYRHQIVGYCGQACAQWWCGAQSNQCSLYNLWKGHEKVRRNCWAARMRGNKTWTWNSIMYWRMLIYVHSLKGNNEVDLNIMFGGKRNKKSYCFIDNLTACTVSCALPLINHVWTQLILLWTTMPHEHMEVKVGQALITKQFI